MSTENLMLDERSTALKSDVTNLFVAGRWYVVSSLLLGIYLGYFHWLNVASPDQVPFLGAAFGSLWMIVCFVCQSIFRNRFEFAIHMLVTLDLFLESLVNVHAGYGFYFCAIAFWTVFWIYHHLPVREASRRGSPSVQPSTSADGI